jgi:hypothetical protein
MLLRVTFSKNDPKEKIGKFFFYLKNFPLYFIFKKIKESEKIFFSDSPL